MSFPSVLYWKWDDTHLQTGKYTEQIADIVARSPFSHIYITTHWCHEGLSCPATLAHLQAAARQLHAAGRKLILEVDVRAEKGPLRHPAPGRPGRIPILAEPSGSSRALLLRHQG